MKQFISVAEVDKLISQHIPSYPSELCLISSSASRILREDIHADRDLPPFNRVTMDGIAIDSKAWAEGQKTFQIEATVEAGVPPPALNDPAKGCIEIMTGAVLPEGCDCIVPYEEIDKVDGAATLRETATPGHMVFVHQQGSDQKKGDILLETGVRLLSPQVAVAACVGRKEILVSSLPKVAFLSTGNELVELGKPIEPYQIRPINNYGVTAALKNNGLPDVSTFHMHDDPEEMRKILQTILSEFDVIILSGGVSMGRYDYVPRILEELKVVPIFHKVRERPGKPMWFGITGDGKPVFGLPGNPVSTMMSTHRYVLPNLEKAMGLRPEKSEFSRLTRDIEFSADLTYFPPVTLALADDGVTEATPVRYNNSGHFTAIGISDGFLELPAETDHFPTGTMVRVHRWRS